MQAGKRRIALLKRVVRLREVEKRRAAARLVEARGTHAKLRALQERSGEIAASYSARRDAGTGDDLARQIRFTAGVQTIRADTAGETRKAEETSRTAMTGLRVAERRQEISASKLEERQRREEIRVQAREAAQLARKLKRPS